MNKEALRCVKKLAFLLGMSAAQVIAALERKKQEEPPRKRRKGFNLVKVPSKKYGFLYYVRYSHNGKLIPSRWCTHTNDEEEAVRFALKNKETLIKNYQVRSALPHNKTIYIWALPLPLRGRADFKSPSRRLRGRVGVGVLIPPI